MAIMILQTFVTTEGYSGADLAAVCIEAALKALEEAIRTGDDNVNKVP